MKERWIQSIIAFVFEKRSYFQLWQTVTHRKVLILEDLLDGTEA